MSVKPKHLPKRLVNGVFVAHDTWVLEPPVCVLEQEWLMALHAGLIGLRGNRAFTTAEQTVEFNLSDAIHSALLELRK